MSITALRTSQRDSITFFLFRLFSDLEPTLFDPIAIIAGSIEASLVHYLGANYASTAYGLHKVYELQAGSQVMEVIRFNNLLIKVTFTGNVDTNPSKDLEDMIALLRKDNEFGADSSPSSSSSSSSSRAKSPSAAANSSVPSLLSPPMPSSSAVKPVVDSSTSFDDLIVRYRHILDGIEDRLREVDALERKMKTEKELSERQIEQLQLQCAASRPVVSPPNSNQRKS